MLVSVPESQRPVSMQAWVVEACRAERAALQDHMLRVGPDLYRGARRVALSLTVHPKPPAMPIAREQALDIALFHEGEEGIRVPSSPGLLSPGGEVVIVDAEMSNDQRDVAHPCIANIAVEGDEADII